jgi:hypothetical protein
MPDWFAPYDLFVAVSLAVALTSIPLAARDARRSWWRTQVAASLAIALVVAGMVCWRIYGGYFPLWRCVVYFVATIMLPNLAAGWGARAAVRAWPRARRTSAVIGGLAGFLLVGGASFMATDGFLPDLVTAVADAHGLAGSPLSRS